jgi:threonine/homoserine/homoserine lactone efflux protein
MAVEPLMVIFIVAGVSVIFGAYTWFIAGLGGLALVIFGLLTIREARTATIDIRVEQAQAVRPFLAGAITSISNPYFWIWWITVGSALLIGAYKGGWVLAVAFIAGHWAADMGWFTLISVSIHRGRFILGERQYRWIVGLCGLFLVLFGIYYLSSLLQQWP